MIEIILKEICKKINADCVFLSKPCGVARIQVERVDKKDKKYPVVENADVATKKKQHYISMTPNTNDAVLCYFEVLNNNLVEKQVGGNVYRSNLRLVGWINTARIKDYEEGTVESHIINAISKKITVPNGLTIRYIEEKGFEPKGAAIFQKYTYSEAEQQFLMHPFDYFAVHFEIGYKHNPRCTKPIVINHDVVC